MIHILQQNTSPFGLWIMIQILQQKTWVLSFQRAHLLSHLAPWESNMLQPCHTKTEIRVLIPWISYIQLLSFKNQSLCLVHFSHRSGLELSWKRNGRQRWRVKPFSLWWEKVFEDRRVNSWAKRINHFRFDKFSSVMFAFLFLEMRS